jgi:hypothetical protein
MAEWKIVGRVLDAASGRPGAGLRVEGWDRDTKYHDLLGGAVTDVDGRFAFAFDERWFGDHAPDRLPDIFFRVFRRDALVHTTESEPRMNVPPGPVQVDLAVRLPPDDAPAPPRPALAALPSAEVALHELGESLAVAAASVQRELARYPSELGAFVLDEIEVSIPARMRVDGYGQVMATVVDTEAAQGAAQIRLRVKPVLGAAIAPPRVLAQPVSKLGVLDAAAVERLAAARIFSVDDLVRVASAPAGRSALEKDGLAPLLDRALDRADVLAMPSIPAAAKEALVDDGVESPTAFVKQDAAALAERLSSRLGEKVTPEDVKLWQRDVGTRIALPRPTIGRRPLPVEPIPPLVDRLRGAAPPAAFVPPTPASLAIPGVAAVHAEPRSGRA